MTAYRHDLELEVSSKERPSPTIIILDIFVGRKTL